MVSGNDLSTFFMGYNHILSGISDVCGILGCVGSFVLFIVNYFFKKKVDGAEKRIKGCEITINSLKAENVQFARIIFNNGLSLADAKVAAEDVFNEKAKYKPDIYTGEEEPEEPSKGMIWPTGS